MAAWGNPAGALAVLGALGVVGYLWVRAAAALFYGPLGVSPEDVGLRYPTVLAQAAYGAAVLLAVCLSMTLGLSVLAAIMGWISAPLARRIGVRILFSAFAIALTINVAWLALGSPPSLLGTILSYTWFLAGVAWISGLSAHRVSAYLQVGVALAIATAAVLSLLMAHGAGMEARKGVANLTKSSFWAPLWPYQRAQVARVRWTGPRPPGHGKATECVLYLGESDAGPLVYAAGADGERQVLRVAPDDGRLVVLPDRTECTSWKPRPK